MKRLAALSALLLTCISTNLRAVDATGADADPDLPQPLDPAFASSLFDGSPFTRSVDLEKTLELTGVAYINGRPVATVLNKDTKQRIVVSEEPNALGWRLTDAVATADPSTTEVQIMVGPESVTMHFAGSQLIGDDGGKKKSSSQLASNGEKFRVSSYLGEDGKKMYVALSPDGREKLRDTVRNHLEKHPELTQAQSSDYAKKIYAKIKASDNGKTTASTSGKSSKSPKPSKKKQGA
jgi:hypothetical protein